MKQSPLTQKLATDLAEGVSSEQVLHVLQQALSADQVNRDGSRGPDHRIRLDAAKTLLAYSVGLPVQRSESVAVNVDADASAGLQERLQHSPQLRDLMRKILNNAENEECKNRDV